MHFLNSAETIRVNVNGASGDHHLESRSVLSVCPEILLPRKAGFSVIGMSPISLQAYR